MTQIYFRINSNGIIDFHCSNTAVVLDKTSLVGTNIRSHFDTVSVSKLEDRLSQKLEKYIAFEVFILKSSTNKNIPAVIHMEREGESVHFFGTLTGPSTNELLIKKYNQLERTLRLSPATVFQFKLHADGQMTMPYVSQRAYEVYDMTAEEHAAEPDLLVKSVHPDDVADMSEKIYASGRDLTLFKWEGRIVRKDKSIRWIYCESVPERFDDGSIVWQGIILDISDKKLLEDRLAKEHARLLHASRMGELGKMAGSIAHEINNPLQAIQMNAERIVALSQQGQLNSENLLQTTQLIIRTSQRVGKIVKGLKDFSRDSSEDSFEMCSMQQLTNTTLDLCLEKLKKHGFEIRIPDHTKDVLFQCNSTQLSQVLLSLINNSFDATRDLPNPWIQIDWQEQNDRLIISVTDSGPGLSEEVMAKIMQPFFTTKAAGVGTGIGLSIALSIVEMHKGHFYVDRECKNTRFCIDIPKQATGDYCAA